MGDDDLVTVYRRWEDGWVWLEDENGNVLRLISAPSGPIVKPVPREEPIALYPETPSE